MKNPSQSVYESCAFAEVAIEDRERPNSVAVAPETRYRNRRLIGAGQMGRVEAAYDTLLRREIALKVLRADASPSARERFAREATTTAHLEHPSIVTVHDSGTLADSRPYYTMQLVRGGPWIPHRTEDADLDLDSLITVCEAVGYAHARGIVHRDLKPANIMVGNFGEVVVVDWGLACHGPGPTERPHPSSAAAAGHEVVGTPLYMSPEQARGEPVEATADVWALGMMLLERLAPDHPFGGLSSAQVLDVLAGGGQRALTCLPASVAPELAAIVERALHPRSSERYPCGTSLAADLRNFVSGQLVSAYDYRSRDLWARFLRTYRVPLVASALALGTLLATGVTAYVRTSAERDRALVAENTARAAERSARAAEHIARKQREASERLSGRLLAAQARVARSDGDIINAERLAHASLARVDAPVARGVLASTLFAAKPSVQETRQLPCPEGAHLSSRGARILCARGNAFEVFGTHTGSTLLDAELSAPLAGVALPDDTGETWVLSGGETLRGYAANGRPMAERAVRAHSLDTDGAVLRIGMTDATHFRLTDGTYIEGQPDEGSNSIVVLGPSGERRFVVHREGPMFLDGQPLQHPLRTETRRINNVLPLSDGRFLIGRDDGKVTSFDPARKLWDTNDLHSGRISAFHDLHDGLVAVTVESAETLIWDVDASTTLLRLPPTWGTQHARRSDGTIISIGDALRVWRLPPRQSSSEYRVNVGLSMATARGDLVVAALGDGSIAAWNADDGTLRWRTHWPERQVLKSVAITSDGRFVVGLPSAAGGLRALDASDGAIAQLVDPPVGEAVAGRRLMLLADGSVWATLWNGHIFRWPDLTSAPTKVGAIRVEDASASEHGHAAVFLEEHADHVSMVLSGRTAIEPLGVVPGARAVDIDDSASTIVVARERDVILFDRNLDERVRWTDLPSPPVDVSIRGDASLVAAGLRDGSIWVWKIGREPPAAHITAHNARTSSVDFVGDALISAGWDGAVHRWGLQPMLDAPLHSPDAIPNDDPLGTH